VQAKYYFEALREKFLRDKKVAFVFVIAGLTRNTCCIIIIIEVLLIRRYNESCG
jgi:hypothetical protein